VWWAVAVTAGAVGFTAALLTTPVSALVASALVFAALALLVTIGVRSERPAAGDAGAPEAAEWRLLLDRTLVGTLTALAVLGLLQVSLAATALVVVILAATAPWALQLRRGTRRAPAATERPAVADPLPDRQEPAEEVVALDAAATPGAAEDLGSLSTAELATAWRRSYAELARVRTPSQLTALAERRRRLLDELERRDADGVATWLRSGARAASDPSRYLRRPGGPSAAAA
jgi:hypothetical protein